jgi:putative glutamine amidotransferase
MLCNNVSSVSHYVNILDGLLLSGTAVDVDPVFYGETFRHKTTITRSTRTQFDLAITRKMLTQGKPILGVNYGCQLINVMHGGTLYQHIIEEIPNAEIHTQEPLLVYPRHIISILPKTKLYNMVLASDSVFAASANNSQTGCFEVKVNSFHHQCVKILGNGLTVTALTQSGVIEGIESTQADFCVGTQWHPEFLLNAVDLAIFQEFIAAASRRAKP